MTATDTKSGGLPEVAAADVGIRDGAETPGQARARKARARTTRSVEEARKKAVHTFKSAFPAICSVCARPMEAGRRGQHRSSCSTECRRLACSARQIVAALEAGRAEGLRPVIAKSIDKPGPRGSGILNNRRLHNAEEKRDVSN
jgi:hypothetical protein